MSASEVLNWGIQMKKFLGASLAAILVTGLLTLASPAQAAPDTGGVVSPQGLCDSSTVYKSVTSNQNYYQPIGPVYHSINGTSYANTVTFMNTVSGSIGATVGGYVEGGVSGGIATAKAQVSGSITASVSYTTQMSVQYTVPARVTGYAQIGTSKWKVNIRTWKYNTNCVSSTIGTGTLDAPTSIGWKTWNG
jgi:hypothetical protein